MFNFMKKGVAGVAGGGGGSGSNNSGTGNGSGGAGGGGAGGSIGSSGGLSVIGALSGLDGDEKDRRKKEKKARKEGKQLLLGVGGGSGTSGGHAGSMSAEELLRLDEVKLSIEYNLFQCFSIKILLLSFAGASIAQDTRQAEREGKVAEWHNGRLQCVLLRPARRGPPGAGPGHGGGAGRR